MAYNGKLLAKAKQRLQSRRLEFEQAHDKRIQQVYDACPHIREIDDALKNTIIGVVGAALGDKVAIENTVSELRERNLALQEQRRRELVSAGFASDYLDDEYLCSRCHDTGYVGAQMCTCLKQLYNDELRASLSSLLKLGDETFETFNLSLYDDTPDPELGISPRSHMEVVCETCYRYAEKFGRASTNLYLNGAPGLGKTFLSAAIANVVANKGFSVVYDTAHAVFSAFEDDKFSKTGDQKTARGDVRRYLESDLLILDDLGTEMTTAFTISALYELINTRLMTNKKTIISSNLSTAELRGRYSAPIVSRIDGEYMSLRFYGRDIRLVKRGL